MTPNQRITAVRKRLKLTQAAFASAMKLKQGYISELESGSKNGRAVNVSEYVKQQLFDLWGVNISWLMNGPDELAGELMFHKNKPPTMYGHLSPGDSVLNEPDSKFPNTSNMDGSYLAGGAAFTEKLSQLNRMIELMQDDIAFHKKIIGSLKEQVDGLEKKLARLGEVARRRAGAG